VEDPAPLGEGEVLLQVSAAGVNRADRLQRHGRPPARRRTRGSSAPASTILALGPNVPPRWAVDDKVELDQLPSLPQCLCCCVCCRPAGLRVA
jgi:NADPH:quinone reductase-like Zn-dependent oxidoreductase